MNAEITAYTLAVSTAGGGIAGYVRTGSVPSLVAGCAVGFIYGLSGYRLQNRQPYGAELSLLASVILGGASIPRAIRTPKPVSVTISFIALYGVANYFMTRRTGV